MRDGGRWLIMRAGGRAIAMRLEGVAEVMRARPTQSLENAPRGVSGVGMIRGVPCPIIELAALFGPAPGAHRPSTRWVALRVGARRIGLAVEEIVGVRMLDERALGECPALLGSDARTHLEALGRLDAELLLVMRGGLVLPEDTWATIEAAR